MGVWYATREDVKSALDSKETARNNGQIDRAIEAVSRLIDRKLHRRFYPEQDTRYFRYPAEWQGRSWRLWLDDDEVISVSALTSGGTALSPSDYFLEPVNFGPPYTHIEINLDGNAAFSSGGTPQRSIAVTGLFGNADDEAPAGALAEALDDSETEVDVTDSAAIGIGQLIRVDSERMIVTGRRALTTGQTLQADLTASAADVTVAVTTGSAYAVDELILVDSERMRIVEIAGNNLTVKRAFDGTVLAAHTTGATIYAGRTLTVERGALGTTAATHDTAAAVRKHTPPGLIRQLTVAECLNELLGEGAGGGANSPDMRYLKDLREQVRDTYGRKARVRAV